MDKNRIKLEELCSFICKEINLKLKPSTCQNRSVNKESNVVSEIKSIRNTTNNNIINKLLNRQVRYYSLRLFSFIYYYISIAIYSLIYIVLFLQDIDLTGLYYFFKISIISYV